MDSASTGNMAPSLVLSGIPLRVPFSKLCMEYWQKWRSANCTYLFLANVGPQVNNLVQ